MNYVQAVRYIEDTMAKGSILGLDRMRTLCDFLGNPEDDLKFIHIAGTNGKGSTSCFVATVLKVAGYKVGQYYSPSLMGMRDHYMVNGQMISEEEYAECVEIVSMANDKMIENEGEGATSFELETALAFVYFKKKSCDIVVLETGMGGRDDATNVVSNKLVSVLTSISFDHMSFLGNTLREIAEVKAGIIIPKCRVVAFESSQEAIEVIKNRCATCNTPLNIVRNIDISDSLNENGNLVINYGEYEDIEISLAGLFQKDNAAIALAVISELVDLGYKISIDDVVTGMKSAYWPYRMERISEEPLIYVDGAHNVNAADRLKESILRCYNTKEMIFVIGMFKDKEYEKIIAQMAPLASTIYTITTPNNPRALDAKIIKNEAMLYCHDVVACDSTHDAAIMAVNKWYEKCKEGKEPMILAFGSLSYLALFKDEVLQILK